MMTNSADVERPRRDHPQPDHLGEENIDDAVIGGESNAEYDALLDDAIEPFDADAEDEETI